MLSAVMVRLSLLTIRVPLLLCEKVCKICRSADVPTSEAAYRSVRTGVSPPPLERTPVPSLLLLLLLLLLLGAPITSHRISGAAVRF